MTDEELIEKAAKAIFASRYTDGMGSNAPEIFNTCERIAEVCLSVFREHNREVAAKAWEEGVEFVFYNSEIRGLVDYPDNNPYRVREHTAPRYADSTEVMAAAEKIAGENRELLDRLAGHTAPTGDEREALARIIDPAIYPDINRLTGDGWAASLRAADAILSVFRFIRRGEADDYDAGAPAEPAVTAPTNEFVKAAAREFERVWNERVADFDPEAHDEPLFIEGIMRVALEAALTEGEKP